MKIDIKQDLSLGKNDLNLVKMLENVTAPVSPSQSIIQYQEEAEVAMKNMETVFSSSNPIGDQQPAWSHQITVKMGKALEQLVENQKQQMKQQRVERKWTRLQALPEKKIMLDTAEINS